MERFWSLMYYAKGFTHSVKKNINYADFKCKAILLKTQSNYKIVLFKFSHLLRFSFCLSKPDSSYLSKIYGHVKKAIIVGYSKNSLG